MHAVDTAVIYFLKENVCIQYHEYTHIWWMLVCWWVNIPKGEATMEKRRGVPVLDEEGRDC